MHHIPHIAALFFQYVVSPQIRGTDAESFHRDTAPLSPGRSARIFKPWSKSCAGRLPVNQFAASSHRQQTFFGFFSASAAFVRKKQILIHNGLPTPQRAEAGWPRDRTECPSAPAKNAEPPRQHGTSRIPRYSGYTAATVFGNM